MKSNGSIAVIGAGTMGSAAAYHIARRGHKVIAFEQFNVVHNQGSHSGATRIIRHAYHESPYYVPLVLRADELWLQLEQQTGTQMLIRTGAIVFGPPKSQIVQGAIAASERYSLPHEKLTATQIMDRWPQFRIQPDWEGCFDPRAGFLLVDACIRSHLQLAKRAGAEVRENESITHIVPNNDGIRIETTKANYEVEKAVVTAGAWSQLLLSELHLPLMVKRRTLTWLRPRNPEPYEIGKFPIFLADVPYGMLYGFPMYASGGVKIANHHARGPSVNPDNVDRNYTNEDAGDVLRFAGEHLPGLSTEIVDSKVCLYTLTPDEDFILDLNPDKDNMIIGAGFSGHGFKFAPVIGEILADLCLERKTAHAIDRFRISRFLQSA